VNGGKAIVVAWFTLAVLLIAVGVWTFTNMGDCPAGAICVRAWWLDPLIFGSAAALWLLGIRQILRKKPN
jgi:hypothetical protein